MNIKPKQLESQTASIHVVRQYGRTGGMERYVWELTHALVKQEQKVKVICEKAHDEYASDIEVVELGTIKPKPRWRSMLKFSDKVSNYVNQHDIDGWVIHSHERCACHHVTTFHGPSILDRKKRLLDCLSPRIKTWEALERRELMADSVKVILPNSIMVAENLKRLYPEAAGKIRAPAYPGVSNHFFTLPKESNGHTIGFIGKEWHRKGLEFACKVVEPLLQDNPLIKFYVAGPAVEDVAHLFSSWPKEQYELLGWTPAETVLPKIDVLIHPAKVEPFGMVIAEANAAGKQVVISDNCGISDMIGNEYGSVLNLDAPLKWQQALKKAMQDPLPHSLNLTWSELALKHSEIYQELLQGL